MEETLGRLEAGVPKSLARVPGLMRLLAHFFALLRGAIERMGQGGVAPDCGDAVVLAAAPVQAEVSVGDVALPVGGRTRKARAQRRVVVVAPVVAVCVGVDARVGLVWGGLALRGDDARGGWGVGGDFFQKFLNSRVVAGWNFVHFVTISK